MEALEHVLAIASREVAAAVQILKSQRPYTSCHIIIHIMSHHHTHHVTSSYTSCHIIIHIMSHHILNSQRPGEFIAKRHTMRTFENGCLKGLTELSSAGLRSKSPDRVAVGGRKIDTSCRTLSLSG